MCTKLPESVDSQKSKPPKKFKPERKRSDLPISASANACEVDFYVMNAQTNLNENFLPTFTAKVQNKTNSFSQFRTLYDPASQATFISQRTSEKLKCKVIEPKLRVNISGFNESKSIVSKSVEFNLFLPNNKTRKIKAIVVPEIRAKLPNDSRLDELRKAFAEHELPLADKHLGDSGLMDILLGVHDARVLPVQSCSFGDMTDPSILFFCSAGVMLCGDISVLHRNLPHLKLFSDFVVKFKSLF